MGNALIRMIKGLILRSEDGQLSRRSWMSPFFHKQSAPSNLMVSLTTIPSRIDLVHVTIDSILRQTLRPIRIVLWLNENQFPNLNNLPSLLLNQKNRGLEIYHCDKTWPHKKLLPSLVKWPDKTIVTADDDVVYPADWLSELYRAHLKSPATIICRRARIIQLDASGELAKYESWPIGGGTMNPSHAIFPTGVSGILYPPGVLHRDVFDTALAEKLCPRADDIWFKIMAFRRNTKCFSILEKLEDLPHVEGSQLITLHSENLAGGGNDVQLAAVLKHFEIDPRTLVENSL